MSTSPSQRSRVTVGLAERSYDILIGTGLIDDARTFAELPRAAAALIVTNETIAPLYAARLKASLSPHYPSVEALVLPDGEIHKDWTTLNRVFDVLLEGNFDRKTVLFALGGGVIGDLTGFAAACFMRGVPFVQVPTTLLAQVDSSVGGKTAINHPHGKNMIGAFYQPRQVVADLGSLTTLPPREIAAGLAEVIKYGPIADDAFFCWLEEHLDDLVRLQPAALEHAVRRSCEIKAEVVGDDEREGGRRAILNFGHTFGHALEGELGFGTWLHGEAVGCGMVMAAELSHRLGLIDVSYRRRIEALVRRAGLPVRAPSLDPDRLIGFMRHDKKSEAGRIRFVVIDKPGQALVREADEGLVRDVLQTCCE